MSNKTLLNNISWNFIKLEENVSPSVLSYLQSLEEQVYSLEEKIKLLEENKDKDIVEEKEK